jgi:PTH1 family peptidyl-tRNA hydrolase
LWAVVGLGNPGLKYRNTRHNAGFLLVRRVAKKAGLRLKKRRFGARIGRMVVDGEEILLALPQTYMNRSGESVKKIVTEADIPPERLVVFYDDLDLPLGDIRVRREGRAGSHRGMISITSALKTRGFPRVRIGIGPLPPDREAADFVLSAFPAADKKRLEFGLTRAQQALQMILAGDITGAMNRHNQRIRPGDNPNNNNRMNNIRHTTIHGMK